MYITSLLPLIGLASALPSLVPRQNTTIDYGYWDAIYTSEGFAAGSTESVTATYSNPGHEANITVSCRSTEYHGQTTRTCDPGFSYTWGAPYDYPNNGVTLGLKQTVELVGEKVIVYGSALLTRQTGQGAGKGSKAFGRIEAGVVPPS